MDSSSDTYMGVKIQKIPPKLCPSCSSTRVHLEKFQKHYCHDCEITFQIKADSSKISSSTIEDYFEFKSLRKKFEV